MQLYPVMGISLAAGILVPKLLSSGWPFQDIIILVAKINTAFVFLFLSSLLFSPLLAGEELDKSLFAICRHGHPSHGGMISY